MKRICVFLCSFVVLMWTVTFAVLPVSAGEGDIAWNSIRPRALYVQDGLRLMSDINPDFSAVWPSFIIPEAGKTAVTSTVNMRGFALSPDGRYAYMSVLHGGGDLVRGMFVMETMTGKIYTYDTRYDGDVCNQALPHFSYPKGLDADTRGYVYMGYTLSASYNEAYLRIVRQNEDGTLTRLSEIPVCSLGLPGDTAGTKVGINGVSVVERDGRVYCYVVTNYDHDALYCFDVTDPESPTLNTSFGDGGRMLFSGTAQNVAGYPLDEALYLDVAADGTVYLCITCTDGRGGIAVIAPDGKSCQRVISASGAYCVELVGEYLLCGSRTGGQISVLHRDTGRSAGTLSVADTYGERITRLQVANGVLFVCDAGSVAGVANAIYAAPLSADGEAFLNAIVNAQSTGVTDWYDEPDTEAVTESPTDPESETDTASPTESDAPADTDALTETGTMASETIDATNVSVGCMSVLPTAVLLPLLLPAAWFIKRKLTNTLRFPNIRR